MEDDDFISKTRRKQEMHALQELGEELVGLKEDKLGELRLPDSLLSAVLEAKHFPSMARCAGSCSISAG
jgi:ribosome-associated protein